MLLAAGHFSLEGPAGHLSEEPFTHLPAAGRKCWGLSALWGETASSAAAQEPSLLSLLLLCCALMQFEEADSSSVTGRQERQLFLQETSSAGHFVGFSSVGRFDCDDRGRGTQIAAWRQSCP